MKHKCVFNFFYRQQQGIGYQQLLMVQLGNFSRYLLDLLYKHRKLVGPNIRKCKNY